MQYYSKKLIKPFPNCLELTIQSEHIHTIDETMIYSTKCTLARSTCILSSELNYKKAERIRHFNEKEACEGEKTLEKDTVEASLYGSRGTRNAQMHVKTD